MKSPPGTPSPTDLAILGLVVICATLAAFASDRQFVAYRNWMTSPPQRTGMPAASTPPTSAAMVESIASRTIQDLQAVLYPASAGLALIAYRPRRGVRHRRRGPGQVALAVAGGLVTWSMAYFCWFTFGPERWTDAQRYRPLGMPANFWVQLPQGFGPSITYGVASAWIYLAAIRGWRGPRSPLERAGRCVGLAWVVASGVTWGVTFLPPP